MDIVIESLLADWQSFLTFAPKLLYGLAMAIAFLVFGKFGGQIIGRLLRRGTRTRSAARFFEHLTSWVVTSIGLLLALGIMGFHGVAKSLLATGGVVAIIIGFAFREIGENFLSGFLLAISRPFEIGDLIQTGSLLGEVRSIELRYVHVRTFDACDVFVPSAQLIRDSLYNFTKDGLRRPSFTVGVAYHEEPDKVIAQLKNAVSNSADVLASPKPFVTVKNFSGQHIEYEVFFWIDVTKSQRSYIEVQNIAKITCWRSLRDANMTFSTDVTTALEIRSVPPIDVSLSRS